MPALRKAVSRQLSVVSCQLSAISYLLSAICFLFIAAFFIFTTPVFAAADPPCTDLWCPLSSDNYQDTIATQRFTRNLLVAGHVTIFGTNPLDGHAYGEKVSYKMKGGKPVAYSIPGIGSVNTDGGALGIASNAIASLYNPPTSSVEYLANLGENMGIAPRSAYAQELSVAGSGQNVIRPVLALWQVTRNIAYVGFILVFIAAGLMIMFRQKLNPQTVIGIQQALPGLVIGLILVTFSYFIAAFIVDLSFVGMRLVTEIFISTQAPNFYACTILNNSGQPCGDVGSTQRIENDKKELEFTYKKSDAFDMYGRAALRTQNVNDIFGQMWGTLSPSPSKTPSGIPPNMNWWEKVGDFLRRTASGASGGTWAGPLGVIIGGFSGAFGYNLPQAAGAGLVSTLSALLIPIILGIALMIQFIRLIIALLMSYLQILVMVIFGPFLILFSAIPGRGGTLGYWLKALIANVLVFPAVFAGFLFAGMLLQWNSSALNQTAMPLFGGLQPDILKSLLAFGVLLGLPSIPDMVREAMGVKGPKGFTQAALGGFMGGFNTGKAATVGGYNQGMERTGIRSQQQAYQKAKLEGAAGAYSYDRTSGKMTGGPGYGPGLISRLRRWRVEH